MRRSSRPGSRRTMSVMTHPTPAATGAEIPPAQPAWSRRAFLRHLLEMMAAMLVGMAVLGPFAALLFDAGGRPDLDDHPVTAALVMATTMTIGMIGWMRWRGHRWAPTAEMGAAMYLPFAVFFPPFWAGLVGGDVVHLGGHVLMVPVMALMMLRRRTEYSTQHRGPPR